MLQLRFPIHAPFARANDGGARIKRKRMGDDREGRETSAGPCRNRSARRELQGNPAEIRARARGILRDDVGQRSERHQPSLVLALRRNRPVPCAIAGGIWRAEPAMRLHQEKSPREFNEENSTKRIFTTRIPGAAGTKPASRSFPVKCSNLARGESTKDPVCIFGCGRGFSLRSE